MDPMVSGLLQLALLVLAFVVHTAQFNGKQEGLVRRARPV